MRLIKKWKTLFVKVQQATSLKNLNKLNNLSLLLGVKRRIALTAFAATVTLGAQAQLSFEEVDREEQIFKTSVDLGYGGGTPIFIDLDNDGDLDLVSSDNENTIQYFVNNGDGFEEQFGLDNPFSSINESSGFTVSLVDLDNDGDQDLVLTTLFELLYFTNDNNVFTEQTDINNPFDNVVIQDIFNINNVISSFADIDNDGDQDLIIGIHSESLRYFRNDDNVFTEQFDSDNPLSAIVNEDSRYLAFADIDGDNDIDLLIGQGEKPLYFRNDDNVFTEQLDANNPFKEIGVYFSFLTFADLDEDGDQDLVKSGGFYSSALEYYVNTKNVFEEEMETTGLFGFNVGFVPFPTFIDLDKDGDQDLVVADYEGENSQINYYVNTDNVFTKQGDENNPFNDFDLNSIVSPIFIDLDRDGDQDLVLGDYNELRYYTNNNNVFIEQFGSNNPFEAIDHEDYNFPVFADIDEDGDQDLIIGLIDTTMAYYINDAGVFTEQLGEDNPFTNVSVDYLTFPNFADIDKDGDQDLVFSDYYGQIKYYVNDTGVFTEQLDEDNPFIGLNTPYRTTTPIFADLDTDGDLDLFISSFSGVFSEYRNNSIISGVFNQTEKEALSIYPNPASSIINTEEGQLEIIDALGNPVLNIESTGIVDISNLETGIYFVSQNEKRTKLVIE